MEVLPDQLINIDNLLVRIHFIIEMISWIGLAPWDFKFPFPCSLTPTSYHAQINNWMITQKHAKGWQCVTTLTRISRKDVPCSE